MKDNKGFSLIEVIIVIAIFAIVTAGAGISVNMIQKANVSKGMREVDNGLDKLVNECLSKSAPTYMYIYQDEDKDYYIKFSKDKYNNIAAVIADSGTKTFIEKNKTTLYWESKSSGSDAIYSNHFVYITFDKSTGSCVAYRAGGTRINDITAIKASRSGRAASVKIAYETGKHSFVEA